MLDSNQAEVFPTSCTNAALAKKEAPGLKIVQIPEALSVDAEYGLIVLNDAPEAAQAFADCILSRERQAMLAQYGFDTPNGG
ncbi:substrate-binding domain-containing protein [Marivita sp.]|uniref:substrate-binding domain-containing protein n=1 Tax=Marivita sp. TaxID=2003365 RepID=UPI0025C4E748|nr:substrate-binding domain-containing protein [Marivita sp.]